MIDSSALVAALAVDHEHHAIARPHLSMSTRIPAIVLAEAYSQLRRTFGQPASVVSQLLAHWTASKHLVLPTTTAAVVAVFGRAVELDIGGNIHDALIAQTCVQHKVGLVTLDARQHQIALALGADSSYLLAPGQRSTEQRRGR